jgi:hypothetical protein
MRLTVNGLRSLIREEYRRVLGESRSGPLGAENIQAIRNLGRDGYVIFRWMPHSEVPKSEKNDDDWGEWGESPEMTFYEAELENELELANADARDEDVEAIWADQDAIYADEFSWENRKFKNLRKYKPPTGDEKVSSYDPREVLYTVIRVKSPSGSRAKIYDVLSGKPEDLDFGEFEPYSPTVPDYNVETQGSLLSSATIVDVVKFLNGEGRDLEGEHGPGGFSLAIDA